MLTLSSTFAALKKDSGRFIIGEHNGTRWATNNYWLIDIDRKRGKTRSPLADLADEFNITGTCVCHVTRHSLRVQPGLNVPDVATILDKLTDDQPIERLAVAGMPVVVEGIGHTGELWRGADGTSYLFNHRLREFVDGVTAEPNASWRAAAGEPMRPGVRRTPDGDVTAVLMPIRFGRPADAENDIVVVTEALDGLLAG